MLKPLPLVPLKIVRKKNLPIKKNLPVRSMQPQAVPAQPSLTQLKEAWEMRMYLANNFEKMVVQEMHRLNVQDAHTFGRGAYYWYEISALRQRAENNVIRFLEENQL